LLRATPYLYLLRVPLLTGLVMAALPFVALATDARSLLANFFDVPDTGIVWVTVAALITAWSVMITSWLIVLYGSRRFKVAPIRIAFPPKPVHLAVFGLLALPAVVGVIVLTASQSQVAPVLLIGAAISGVAMNAFLVYRISTLVNMLSGVADLIPMLAWLGPGYTITGAQAARQEIYPKRMPGWTSGRVLLPGHALALAAQIGFFTLYLLIGVAKWARQGSAPVLPTLGYLFLLLTVLCFGLTALTFFFDRHRLPILIPLMVLFLITSQFSSSDHYFPVVARDPAQAASLLPGEALRAGGRRSAIVVAANGGGIQAASWTAQVLTGLEEQCREEAIRGCRDFGQSVRLISSVSGGSIGSMYFVDAYDPRTHRLQRDLQPVRQRAEASSQDDIAWGLAYPDLLRAVLPWFWKHHDRGMALENALTRGPGVSVPLSAWRRGVREGWRPATVFNATVVDTGERLLLSTTDIPAKQQAARRDLYSANFASGNDVKVVTAARLSASFPYVTPAARADLPGPHVHIVDGGYYDNYGVSTLVEWLDEGLNSQNNPVERVLLVEIRGSPETRFAEPESHGWFYQVFAPVLAMLHVRTSGQFAHNRVESDLLTRLWKRTDGTPIVQRAVFQFCGSGAPLSWHLTPKQKGAIADAWKRELQYGSDWKRVIRFLAGDAELPPEPASPCR